MNLNPIVVTTLSVAIADVDPGRVVPQGTIVTPVSMTNVLAPGPNKSNRTILWMDQEALEVISITATTATCNRGVLGTLKAPHAAGTQIWVGPEAAFTAFIQELGPLPGLGLGGPTHVNIDTANPFGAVGTATLTAQQMLDKIISGVPTGAATYTTDTATNIVAALKAISTPFIGQSFEFVVVNTSGGANSITMAAGSGVTFYPTSGLAVAQNKAARFIAVVTGVVTPAVTIYQMAGA